MPRKRTPKYTHHKPSGQARVRIDGKDHYLGAYTSAESHARYDQLIARWLTRQSLDTATLTCRMLSLMYLEFAEGYYRKNGQPTPEVHAIRVVMRHLCRKHGKTLCCRFGPKALREVRQSMIDAGMVRLSVNRNVGRIRRAFKWAVSEERLDANVWHRLQSVESLRKGRTPAKESEPVRPVEQPDIDAILPEVGRQIAGMIQLQILTGMRPGEVCAMRGVNLIAADEGMWAYIPASHKTEHHDIDRSIYIGPKAQQLLASYLKANSELPVFSPAEARLEHNARRRASRTVKVWPSHEKRRPGEHGLDWHKPYTRNSYSQAVRRACQRAGIKPWHPHQLRHNAATELRKLFGLEAARTVLGHSSMTVTEVYAEMDREKAREAMRKVG